MIQAHNRKNKSNICREDDRQSPDKAKEQVNKSEMIEACWKTSSAGRDVAGKYLSDITMLAMISRALAGIIRNALGFLHL